MIHYDVIDCIQDEQAKEIVLRVCRFLEETNHPKVESLSIFNTTITGLRETPYTIVNNHNNRVFEFSEGYQDNFYYTFKIEFNAPTTYVRKSSNAGRVSQIDYPWYRKICSELHDLSNQAFFYHDNDEYSREYLSKFSEEDFREVFRKNN